MVGSVKKNTFNIAKLHKKNLFEIPTSSTNISKTPRSLWKSQTIRSRKPPIVAQQNTLPTRNSWRVYTKCEPKSIFYSSLAAIIFDESPLQNEFLHARWFNDTKSQKHSRDSRFLDREPWFLSVPEPFKDEPRKKPLDLWPYIIPVV